MLTIGLTGCLFYSIHKGFFPIEDTGFIVGGTETAEDTSYGGMVEKQMKVDAVMRANPYVVSYNMEVGLGGSRFGINSGDLYIQLKPRNQRPPIGEVIQQLRRQVGAVTGINVFLNPVQNLKIGARPSKSLYQYTLQAGNLDELFRFAPLVDAEIRKLPGCRTYPRICRSRARRPSSTSTSRRRRRSASPPSRFAPPSTTRSDRDRWRRSIPPATTMR